MNSTHTPCSVCRGSGAAVGTLEYDQDTGYADGIECPECNGTGREPQEAQLAAADFNYCDCTHEMMESMAHDYALGQECARRGLPEPRETNIAFHAGFMDGKQEKNDRS